MNENNDPSQPERPVVTDRQPFEDDTTQPTYIPTPAEPKPVRKKKLWWIIGGVLALIVAGLLLAYAYWYQNPAKVVSDGVMNALSAKTVSYTGDVTVGGDTKTTIALAGTGADNGGTLDAKLNFDVQGTKYTLEGNTLMTDNGDLYFKVKSIDELVKNYRNAVPESSKPLFDQMIDKVNDKWIKVSADDIRSYSEEVARVQECMADATKKMREDNAVRSELTALYREHQFITIDEKLGSKDGSLGYRLGADRDTAKAFAAGFKDTTLYKSMHDCDESFTINENDLLKEVKDADETSTVEVWVDRWSHQITQVSADTSSKGDAVDMTIRPTFNTDVKITAPTDATTIKQLQADLQALIQSSSAAASPRQ